MLTVRNKRLVGIHCALCYVKRITIYVTMIKKLKKRVGFAEPYLKEASVFNRFGKTHHTIPYMPFHQHYTRPRPWSEYRWGQLFSSLWWDLRFVLALIRDDYFSCLRFISFNRESVMMIYERILMTRRVSISSLMALQYWWLNFLVITRYILWSVQLRATCWLFEQAPFSWFRTFLPLKISHFPFFLISCSLSLPFF